MTSTKPQSGQAPKAKKPGAKNSSKSGSSGGAQAANAAAKAAPKAGAKATTDKKPARGVIIAEADFVAAAVRHDQLPPSIYGEIALAGKSNVGKSSFLNALLARHKLARRSSTPGCTRGLNLYRSKLKVQDQITMLDLVDLPGYGYAERSKAERRSWGSMIEEFLVARGSLMLVVVLVDARRGLDHDDAELVEYLEHLGRAYILVATKVDKMGASERGTALARLKKQVRGRVYLWSSETLEGREDVWRELRKLVFSEASAASSA